LSSFQRLAGVASLATAAAIVADNAFWIAYVPSRAFDESRAAGDATYGVALLAAVRPAALVVFGLATLAMAAFALVPVALWSRIRGHAPNAAPAVGVIGAMAATLLVLGTAWEWGFFHVVGTGDIPVRSLAQAFPAFNALGDGAADGGILLLGVFMAVAGLAGWGRGIPRPLAGFGVVAGAVQVMALNVGLPPLLTLVWLVWMGVYLASARPSPAAARLAATAAPIR
jgi:hypothetical protein